MRDKVEQLIQELTARREAILEIYLGALENYDGHRAADAAGELHDVDRHITNLHLEVKRINGLKVIEEALHA